MTGCAKASVSNHMLSFTRECVRKTYHGKWVVPEMQPVLTYMVLPGAAGATGDAGETAGIGRPRFDDFTLHRVIAGLRELEDEDPLLRVDWVERVHELRVQLLGARSWRSSNRPCTTGSDST